MIYRAVRQDWLLEISLLLEAASEEKTDAMDEQIVSALGIIEDMLLSAPRFTGLSEAEMKNG